MSECCTYLQYILGIVLLFWILIRVVDYLDYKDIEKKYKEADNEKDKR